MNSIKNILRGISWIGLFRVVFRVISFVKIAILARLLTPFDFGIFAVASLVLALLEKITETGINVFLIQENKELEEYVNTAWVVSIIRGLMISLLMFFFARIIANFFHIKEAIYLLRLISIVPLLRGFINPAIIKFQKNLQFNKEFYLRSTLVFADLIVCLAVVFITGSVIGLVYGLITSTIFEIVFSFIFIVPRPHLFFDKQQAKTIIFRGKWVNFYGLTDYLFENLDNMVVGRILGTSYLGFYNMAYKISYLPISEVAQVFSTVSFPSYVKMNDNKKQVKDYLIKISLSVLMLTVPAMLALFFWPKQLIGIFLGEKWLEITPVLKILAIFGVLKGYIYSCYSLFLAVKRQNYVSIISFSGLLGLVLTIIPFTVRMGLVGA